MDLVSVIIPIYNSEESLAQTIASVLNQSYKEIELILIDDGSDDASLEICKGFSKMDSRVIVKTQPNLGVSAARNAGISLARGGWIYFLDSDDYVDKELIKSASNYFHDTVDVIQIGSRHVLGDKVLGYRSTLQCGDKKVTGFSQFIQNSNIGALCVWLHVIRRSLITQNHIYFQEDMSHNEDMLFMYNVLAVIRNAYFIGKILHTQALVPNSLSRSPMTSLKVENRLLLVDRILELSDKYPDMERDLCVEANAMLKGFFGYLLQMRDEAGGDIDEHVQSYHVLYGKRKDKLNSLFAKLGAYNVGVVLALLKLKLLLNKVAA